MEGQQDLLSREALEGSGGYRIAAEVELGRAAAATSRSGAKVPELGKLFLQKPGSSQNED